jgi:hypothetical protein
MAFIQKMDPVVINIKLTTQGRERLSRGKLTFSKFVVGDSEIDYSLIRNEGLRGDDFKILRPLDMNPNILSAIPRYQDGDIYNNITDVPSTKDVVETVTSSMGFFDIEGDFISVSGKTSTEYVRQADCWVGSIVSENELRIQHDDGSNANEPFVGDFLMVRWGNNTVSNVIDLNDPTPVLFYKVLLKTGTLENDDLIVVVDRKLPDFVGGVKYYGCVFFKPLIESEYIDDYVSGLLPFPFWKMSIVFTENIVGVTDDLKRFSEFNTIKYGGFLTYIQNQSPEIKKIGIIHYTNQSPLNTYAEQLSFNLDNIPTLKIPTIMWHFSEDNKMGLILKADGEQKTSMGRYYDLVDNWENVVGKVFIDLKVFVIEDQELLFAMSYKSNRSWTLPNFRVSVGESIECP